MVPDRIEREMVLRHPVERVWQALTTAEGLAGWFGSHAEIDLRPGGRLHLRWEQPSMENDATVTMVEPPGRFGCRWGIQGLPSDDPRRTEVVFTLSPVAEGTRLRVVESGFAQVAEDVARQAHLDEPSGRRHPYRLDPAPIRVALVWLSALATDWDDRLAGLARLLDGAPADDPGQAGR